MMAKCYNPDCPFYGPNRNCSAADGCGGYTAPTNADRIRAMTDEELATWILKNVDCDKENIMCYPELYKTSNRCNGRCAAGRLNWLKQEVKE